MDTLLATNMKLEEKEIILADDYGMVMDDNMVEEMGHMCNLGEGIWEKALKEGIEQGEMLKVISLIRSKLEKGKSVEDIADTLEEDVEFVRSIMKLHEENKNATDLEILGSCCKS